MLKWTGLITKLEHSHPEFQMPNVKAKYFKNFCNTTTVQFQHFLSLSHSLFLYSLPSLFRPATMKRPRTALMQTKTWDCGTHSHHSHSESTQLTAVTLFLSLVDGSGMGLSPWCLLIVAVGLPPWVWVLLSMGLGFAHDGGDCGLLHLVLIVLMVD